MAWIPQSVQSYYQRCPRILELLKQTFPNVDKADFNVTVSVFFISTLSAAQLVELLSSRMISFPGSHQNQA
jgi:hypothetical protein